MILAVKQRRATSANNQFFIISETLEQALDDLLLAFGYLPLSNVNHELLTLENHILLENIKKVQINGILINCHCVKAVTNASKFFADLSELSFEQKIIINQENFVSKVKDIYEKNNDSTLKLSIEKIMKNDINDNSIFNWEVCHAYAQNWVLSTIHLPLLSKIYNVTIHSCTIIQHPTEGRIFMTKEKIPIEYDTQRVFVVLNNDQQQHIIGLFTSCELRLNYLYNQLVLSDTVEFKISVYHQIALNHRLKAEHNEKNHHLKALRSWHSAMENYSEILTLSNTNDLQAALGYGRCLIMLSKFIRAIEFLSETIKTPRNLMTAEGWYLLGVARRKRHLYEEAKYAIEVALQPDQNYADAKSELQIIDRLQDETIEERLKIYKNMTTTYSKQHRTDSYNILSIDGGGVRGIMPAVLISEIERRTNRSAASLFHSMAGTSTGAIIAAGLSTPEFSIDEPVKPRYKSSDIVQLYHEHSSEVFKQSPSLIYNFRRPVTQESKYIDEGRYELFRRYFGDTKISNALTDLIIPAVRHDSKSTHIFNTYTSFCDKKEDYKLYDILMCTTAAPTYFQPYKLGSKSYVDGGVQMNNPAMAAYTQAKSGNTSQENIFILSLGTGDYIPDPIKPDAYRHLLFYVKNSREVLNIVFDGPQSNTDLHLLHIMEKDKYCRWQMWLEEPVELDDCQETTINCLYDHARAFFEEIDAYDNGKRLGLVLDRLKGDEH
ncbi:unnamed protein product [Adineta steineri]|uniref:PNPLA domain-containing protein n=1 Tax=Adineta steineri TaxID=433720 RepID=A0A814GIY4_9BILA|nr:unnamed protein product [Adineta steineri]CAF3532559.1 unnamed protein product [Adineta steineri]